MPLVTSGVEYGNLRELALARMKDMGSEVKKHCIQRKYLSVCPETFALVNTFPPFWCLQCRDVRTREVGIQEIHHKVRPYQVILSVLTLCAWLDLLNPASAWLWTDTSACACRWS